MGYSWQEKCDMYNIFISNGRNARASLREYQGKFPLRRQPQKGIFRYTETVFRNTRTFVNEKRNRRKPVATEEVELNVLLYFQDSPGKSIRNCCRELNLTYGTIRRILKKHKYRAFSQMPVQKLLPLDNNLRLHFCETILGRYNLNNPNIFHNILWTDESSFKTSGCFNRKNTHYWASENPHIYQEIQFQGRQSINVWCGFLNNKIIGPIFFNGSLTGARYLSFLRDSIDNLLDDIPLNEIRDIIWQQDGAPCHNVIGVRQFLNNNYREWIGKYGTVAWPPRSPDLTPLDTFLWGHLKNKVYSLPNLTLDIIQNVISEEIEFLNNNNIILNNVIFNIIRRYNLCVEQNGGHIENLV